MSPVAAPADRRFRRARVKPTRKKGLLATVILPAIKYAVIITAGTYAVYQAVNVVANARMLRVNHIVVHGNERLSSEDVLELVSDLRGENIVWTDLAEWRKRLLASPWVRDVALRRSLPATVEVVVSERLPIAIGRMNGELQLIDETGALIDRYGPQYADLDLPIVDGLSPSGANAVIDQPRAELVARLIASLRPEPPVAGKLSQINVSDVHNAAVILNGDPAVIYVGEERFLPRLRSYLELSSALKARVPDIDYVDLRFDDRIYVRPVKSRKTAAPIVFGR